MIRIGYNYNMEYQMALENPHKIEQKIEHFKNICLLFGK